LPNSKRANDSADVAATVSPAVIAHLLRHLNDGSALRANAVAAPYFAAGPADGESDDESLMRIRAAVEGAVLRIFDECSDRSHVYARRRRTILEQCDLRSRPREEVAAELGLSRRQFYRDRSEAIRLLAAFFTHAARRPEPRSMPSEFELSLEYAQSLAHLGRRSAAIASIKALVASRPAFDQQVRALLSLAELHGDAGMLDHARAALQDARAVSTRLPLTAETRILRLEIDAANARLDWLSGRPDATQSTHERILAQLRDQDLLHERRAFELEALSWMRLGMLSRDVGDPAESLRLLQRADTTLRSVLKPTPTLRAELAGNFGLTQMVLPDGLFDATVSMQCYLDLAREHNLLCDAADALANLSTLYLQRGEMDDARAYARSGLALAQRVSSKPQRADIAIIAALAEAESGNVTEALRLIEFARADVVQPSPTWVLAGLALAQALLYARQFARAQNIANAAAASMSAMGMSRYCGAALRIAAEAAEGGNHPAEAERTIQEAITLLETRGHAVSLARAYECRARLTRRESDVRRARELRKSVR
jgi:tetratricopeptide (TPR) repeat protein